MAPVELVLIAIGLSMDAFAVSVCKGLAMPKLDMRYALVAALFFGGFQALMPLIGWAAGSLFAQFVTSVAHWIAFVLLVIVGAKMIWDTFHEDDGDADEHPHIDVRELLVLAVATSIDALAVGVSFAMVDVAILPSIAVIGCITFVFTLAGVWIGHAFGTRWEKPATVFGGVVLIVIGIKILIEHL